VEPVTTRAWVLNLDAEDELEAGRRYTPSAATAARIALIARSIAPSLGPDAHVLEPDGSGAVPHGARAFAWCPTPRAIRQIEAAGLTPPPAPTFEVLRRVNERGFAFDLAGDELPDVRRAETLDDVEAHVGARGPTGRWLLKRGFGVAGRGQRPIDAGRTSDADRAWILASLRRGALYV
jgi:hypothetical protein